MTNRSVTAALHAAQIAGACHEACVKLPGSKVDGVAEAPIGHGFIVERDGHRFTVWVFPQEENAFYGVPLT